MSSISNSIHTRHPWKRWLGLKADKGIRSFSNMMPTPKTDRAFTDECMSSPMIYPRLCIFPFMWFKMKIMCSVVKIFVLIEVLGRLPITLIVSVICVVYMCGFLSFSRQTQCGCIAFWAISFPLDRLCCLTYCNIIFTVNVLFCWNMYLMLFNSTVASGNMTTFVYIEPPNNKSSQSSCF